ncbi:MAG TPA: hypothetical protein VFI31_08245 [Pirellulales bacterium]|nr:hypothetical protein [Pirellulales bacterium]
MDHNKPNEHCLKASDQRGLLRHAERVYDLVWRVDFTSPGFCSIAMPAGVDSHALRSAMIGLKERLSELSIGRGGKPFVYKSLGRFDQQVTTKFHLDGAPDQSMLILGYEPSKVRSRVLLADYSQTAFQMGITPKDFLRDFNPMYQEGEELLRPYATELPPAEDGRSRILLINNSSLPFTEARTNTLGVMHQAIIVTPDTLLPRIVNSTMLAAEASADVDRQMVAEFIATDEISKKPY